MLTLLLAFYVDLCAYASDWAFGILISHSILCVWSRDAWLGNGGR